MQKKNCKFTVLQVFRLLLLFPFFSVKDAFHYSASALGRVFACEKDMFYRFMEDDGIDWRNILYVINNQLVNRLSIRSDSQKSKLPVCLIADDTDMPKTGFRMELMGRVHSHVLGKSILGFKGCSSPVRTARRKPCLTAPWLARMATILIVRAVCQKNRSANNTPRIVPVTATGRRA